jgi:hypothetical protein
MSLTDRKEVGEWRRFVPCGCLASRYYRSASHLRLDGPYSLRNAQVTNNSAIPQVHYYSVLYRTVERSRREHQ